MTIKRDLTDKFLKRVLEAGKTQAALEEVGINPASRRPIVWDGAVSGFGVRLNESRPPRLTFVLVARFGGARHPAPRAIGEYPTVTLAEARDVARQWRRDLEQGVDPKLKAQASRRAAEALRREEERRAKNTFRLAFADYVAERRAEKDESGETKMRSLEIVARAVERHVLPTLGDRPLAEVTRADANVLLKQIAKTAPTNARRIRSYLRTFGAWVEDDDRIAESPFANLKRLGTENSRERNLSDLEICAIWRASAKLGAFGRAVRFMLATGQRRGEVGALQWREIDEVKRLWTLPRSRAKNNLEHETPLSDLALSILAESAKIGPHVFATRVPRTGAGEQLCATTAPLSGWSKPKMRLDQLALAELRELSDDHYAVFPEWHLHDLRRSCATNLARLQVERVVISKILNHAEGGVTKTYDRYGYVPEKRSALERWGQRLQAIVADSCEENLTSIVTGRPS